MISYDEMRQNNKLIHYQGLKEAVIDSSAKLNYRRPLKVSDTSSHQLLLKDF